MATSTPELRPRKEQQRGKQTRRRLLDAVVECLVEFGYQRTTTQEVARRAGVTRGALLHHYPTREQLVAAAITHLDLMRLADFQQRFAALDPSGDLADAAVEVLWSLTRDPKGYAELELLTAARTDPALKAALSPHLHQRSYTVLEAQLESLGFPPSDPDLRAIRDLVFHALRGLSLAILFDHSEEVAQRELELLKETMRHAFELAGENSR